MKIIPVIDVLGGVTVHAVKGLRKEYKPLKSVLCKSPDPIEVGNAFKRMGFKNLYIADLDAIMYGKLNLLLLKDMKEKTGIDEIMVDVGTYSYTKTEKILKTGISKIVVGTETLQSTLDLIKVLEKIKAEKIVVSLDLINGKLLTKCVELKEKPLDMVSMLFENFGVKMLIVLELSKVGSGEGPNFNVVEKILQKIHVPLIVGGGIRNMEDILKLEKMGVYGVLIATALHNGKIRREDLKQFLG
ncbi:HisA/HisF family protein [Candidatus Bathyarchaeota archaeon]|nr:MAG: HisA/HisF family protein [Candidatus Bathyarchaeota archaeon]